MLCLFQAAATGKSAKTVREFLEKNYSEEAVSTRDGVILLAIRALLEVRSVMIMETLCLVGIL